jgi:uncharacterized protein
MRHVPNPERLIQNIVQVLVDSPDKVSVKAISANNAIMLQVSVAANEVGQVIGRQGRTARSIRTLLASMSAVTKTRYSLDILAEQNSEPAIEEERVFSLQSNV